MAFRLRQTGRIAAVAAITGVVLASCARFDDASSSPFSPEPTRDLGGEVAPESPSSTTRAPRPSGPCIDPDPAVVVSCLETTGGLAVLPDGQSALVAERITGRILQVTQDRKPIEVARLAVDAGGDGGLTDIALSPTYSEDRLIYAYITTGSDNRIVRLTAGDAPKDILTGIPKGPDGNAGAIDFTGNNEMVVLTGNAGSPAAANDPASRAGKLLSVQNPSATGNSPTKVLLSGIGAVGDVCPDAGGNLWVTDRTETEDRLQKVTESGTVMSPVWTWPDKPGVAGCVSGAETVLINLEFAKALAVVRVEPSNGTVTTAPTLTLQDRYGALGGADLGPDGMVWVATVNKTSGKPGPNVDRVVRIPPPSPSGGGPD